MSRKHSKPLLTGRGCELKVTQRHPKRVPSRAHRRITRRNTEEMRNMFAQTKGRY